MLLRLLSVVVLLSSMVPAWGQRVFFKAKLPQDPPGLKFDTNNVPVADFVSEINASSARQNGRTVDINFAPNIIMLPDGQRAFISFPGSDKVGVFHPKTGEFVNFVTVGKNPASLQLSPDGKRIAVISLFLKENLPQPGGEFQGQRIGSISVIDVDTLEVRTLNLKEVFFSFANNVVFSQDGKTGFVASSLTDEILRFDVDSMTEITPRLKMTAGSRPSSLSMAPNFRFFTVVTVGSTNLDKLKNPDAVVVIDPASFSVVRTIVPETNKPDTLIHDFTAPNTVAISPDSKYGLVTDVQNSLLGLIPELSTDRAFLIDFEQGKVVKTLNVGGVASGSYVAPDGRFLVMSALEVAFIDPRVPLEDMTAKRIVPQRSDFRPYSRPAFSKDGKFMFVGAPLEDVILVVELATGAVTRFFEVGGEVEREDGVKLSSAPLELAMTPDGEVLVSVNFNANTLDLIRGTERFFVPRIVSSSEFFTGVAVTNLDEAAAELIVMGRNTGGVPFADLQDTEVVEFVNPRTLSIPPRSQLAQTVGEILQAAEGQVVDGWLDLDTDRRPVTSFFMIGDHVLKRLDGGTALARAGRQVVLPEVRVTQGMSTELTVVNPFLSATTAKITLFNQEGTQVGELSRTIPGNAMTVGFVRDPNPDDGNDVGLFPESAFENFESGYLVVSSEEGVIAFERYWDSERLSVLNGVRMVPDEQLPGPQFVPQVALFEGSETFLNLVNMSSEKAAVTLQFRGNGGQSLAPPVTVEVEGKKVLRKSVAELFGLTSSGQTVSGWIQIDSDRTELIGDAELQVFSGRGMTSIPLQRRLSREIVFSHVAQGRGLSTGLAALNPGGTAANVTLEVFRPNGELVASRTLVLGAEQRDIRLLSEHFPGLPTLLGGYVRITSDQPIIALELFFADNLELISAVPGQRVN